MGSLADRLERTGRMELDEWFWHYEFRFDLRDATRGEQEAIRTLFLAQRLNLNGFTERHIELVELVLGHGAVARQSLMLLDTPALVARYEATPPGDVCERAYLMEELLERGRIGRAAARREP